MLTIKRLSLTEAKVLIQGATQKSLEMNIPIIRKSIYKKYQLKSIII